MPIQFHHDPDEGGWLHNQILERAEPFDDNALETACSPVRAPADSERDRPLDFHWRVDKNAVKCAGLRATGESSYDRAVRSIVAALVLAHQAGGGWVSYSRRREFYGHMTRYHGIPYTYANVTKAVAQLLGLGLAEEIRARSGDNFRTGLQSRIRATSKLAEAFENVGIAFDPIEVIRLKDTDAKTLAYTDTDRTCRWRREIEKINKDFSSVRLTLPPECIPRGEEHVEVDGAIIRITPSPVLYRVFSRGSWNKNGRMYWWGQNLPATSRAGMLIDGEAVVEVDYAALHPRMLYARRGVKLDVNFDPYAVRGFPRPHAKLALLVGINAASRQSAIKALLKTTDKKGALWQYDHATTGRLFDAVVERNDAIAEDIGSDAGIDLMHDDSEIAIRVVKKCLARNIVCLPVHDSFIVQARHGAALKSIMDEQIMRYEERVRPSVADRSTHCNEMEKTVFGSTYGIGEREGVAGEVGVSKANQIRSAPGLAKSTIGPRGTATSISARVRKHKIGASERTSRAEAPFDRTEQRRREAAWLANPSQEYIPTPGESEFLLWKWMTSPEYYAILKKSNPEDAWNRVLGTHAAYCAILKRSNPDDARNRVFGTAGGIPPVPTLAERRAGHRLPAS